MDLRSTGHYGNGLSLVSPGRAVCRSTHVVSHLDKSLEVIWGRLSSSWGRCYTAARQVLRSQCHRHGKEAYAKLGNDVCDHVADLLGCQLLIMFATKRNVGFQTQEIALLQVRNVHESSYLCSH